MKNLFFPLLPSCIQKFPDTLSDISAAAATFDLQVLIDGGGYPINTGNAGIFRIKGFAGTIKSVTLLADQAGNIVMDIWKQTYAGYPPTVANTITAGAKPTLVAANKYYDAGLAGWTIAIADGDCFYFNVDSASILTRCLLMLEIQRT